MLWAPASSPHGGRGALRPQPPRSDVTRADHFPDVHAAYRLLHRGDAAAASAFLAERLADALYGGGGLASRRGDAHAMVSLAHLTEIMGVAQLQLAEEDPSGRRQRLAVAERNFLTACTLPVVDRVRRTRRGI